MRSGEEKRQWADDHGYVSGRCPIHGHFWSDAGLMCPTCAERTTDDCEPKPETPTCDWCGDPMPDPSKVVEETCSIFQKPRQFRYHDYCAAEALEETKRIASTSAEPIVGFSPNPTP